MSRSLTRKPEIIRTWSEWSAVIAKYKSANDLLHLRQTHSLQHFFICMTTSCNFSTSDRESFCTHQQLEHVLQKVLCVHCLGEFQAGSELTEHMLLSHNNRVYQCKLCLYRAASKSHIKMHSLEYHQSHPNFYLCSELNGIKPSGQLSRMDVGSPFKCFVKGCSFETCISRYFLAHSCNKHPELRKLPCFCCNQNVELSKILAHFCIHGLGSFECVYCRYGCNNRKDILNHYCLNHADLPIRLYVRAQNTFGNRRVVEETSTEDSTCDTKCRDMVNKFQTTYVGKSYCSVKDCFLTMNSLEEFKDHFLQSHSNLTALPQQPKKISPLSSSENLKPYGPKIFLCSVTGCNFVHTDQRAVLRHCAKMHQNNNPNIIEASYKLRPIKRKR